MRRLSLLIAVLGCGLLRGAPAAANEDSRFHAALRGLNEVPTNLSLGRAHLVLHISDDETTIRFTLEYRDLSGPPLVAHVHVGAKATNGGVSFFFCGGAKPACPTGTSGSVSGVVQAADIVGPAAQGVDPGDLATLIRAIRHGVTYANMHTAKYPAGEIRGQLLGHSEERDEAEEN